MTRFDFFVKHGEKLRFENGLEFSKNIEINTEGDYTLFKEFFP